MAGWQCELLRSGSARAEQLEVALSSAVQRGDEQRDDAEKLRVEVEQIRESSKVSIGSWVLGQ